MKIIIHAQEGVSEYEAVELVFKVMQMGDVSEHKGRAIPCYATSFTRGSNDEKVIVTLDTPRHEHTLTFRVFPKT